MENNKYTYLENAKKLIQLGGQSNLRYAALELRFCMEAITYEKLKHSACRIPPAVLKKWQPPQAVKALLEHEPNADKSFTLLVGKEEAYGVPSKNMKVIGVHNTFNLKWLRKHYNKIGGLLHYQHEPEHNYKNSNTELKNYLNIIVSDIENVINSPIRSAWFGITYEFNCKNCSELVVYGKHTIEKSGHIICQNQNCNAEYYASLINGDKNAIFELKITQFKCIGCNDLISVENRFLKIGYTFECENCKRVHKIEERHWAYSTDG